MRQGKVHPNLAGERLGTSLYDERGRTLLSAGTVLTGGYLNGLAARGYRSVYLLDQIAPDLVPDEGVRLETRARTEVCLRRALSRVEAGQRLDVAGLRSAVDAVLDDLWADTSACHEFAALRSVGDYQCGHGVQVLVLSLILGTALGYDRARQRALGIGALLHDVGNVHFPELVRRPGPLEPEEHEALQRHTALGYEMLRRNPGIELLSAHVAYQHHERLDGGGYLRRMTGEQIIEFAKIAAIADVYDAAASDRPHRRGLPADQAMAELLGEADRGRLDAQMARSLQRRLAIYPAGSIVRLTTGELGVVARQAARGPAFPRVRVLTDPAMQAVDPYETDVHPGNPIAAVLADYPGRVRRQLRGA